MKLTTGKMHQSSFRHLPVTYWLYAWNGQKCSSQKWWQVVAQGLVIGDHTIKVHKCLYQNKSCMFVGAYTRSAAQGLYRKWQIFWAHQWPIGARTERRRVGTRGRFHDIKWIGGNIYDLLFGTIPLIFCVGVRERFCCTLFPVSKAASPRNVRPPSGSITASRAVPSSSI